MHPQWNAARGDRRRRPPRRCPGVRTVRIRSPPPPRQHRGGGVQCRRRLSARHRPGARLAMLIGYNTWSMATVPYQAFIPTLAEIGFRAIAISVVPSYPIGGRTVPNACALEHLTLADRARLKTSLRE